MSLFRLLFKKKRKKYIEVPVFCPICGEKLQHVNAIKTEAHVYFVWCPTKGCKYCKEWQIKEEEIKEIEKWA